MSFLRTVAFNGYIYSANSVFLNKLMDFELLTSFFSLSKQMFLEIIMRNTSI